MAIVTIDGKDIEMIANAATGIVHERIFKEDIMNLSQKIGQDAAKKEAARKEELEEEQEPEYTEGDALAISLAKHLAFTMAMQAEYLGKEEKLMALGEPQFIKWLTQFSNPFAIEEATEEIWGVYYGDDTPTAEAKKEAAPQTDH